MKNMKISTASYLLLAVMLISMSAGVISNLTKRSNSQVVLHSNDITALTNQVNQYYNQGYRITFSVGQSVSTSIIGSNGYSYNKQYNSSYRDLKGEIMVVMER